MTPTERRTLSAIAQQMNAALMDLRQLPLFPTRPNRTDVDAKDSALGRLALAALACTTMAEKRSGRER